MIDVVSVLLSVDIDSPFSVAIVKSKLLTIKAGWNRVGIYGLDSGRLQIVPT